jgi:hypothetical protein
MRVWARRAEAIKLAGWYQSLQVAGSNQGLGCEEGDNHPRLQTAGVLLATVGTG